MKSTNLNFPQTLAAAAVIFVNADGTAAKDLISAGADDSRITSLVAASDDTSAVNVQILLHDGTNARLLGTTRVATLSGTDGAAPSVDLINSTSIPGLPVDANGKRYLPLPAGSKIQVAPLAAITAAKTLSVTALGEHY